MAKQQTNEQAALAEDAKTALRRSREHSGEAALAYVESGQKLMAVKAITPHGLWSVVLERAGVNERTARRMMDCAALGLKSDTVSDLGISILQGLARFMRRSRKAGRGVWALLWVALWVATRRKRFRWHQ